MMPVTFYADYFQRPEACRRHGRWRIFERSPDRAECGFTAAPCPTCYPATAMREAFHDNDVLFRMVGAIPGPSPIGGAVRV
jgi:hypothetical protein